MRDTDGVLGQEVKTTAWKAGKAVVFTARVGKRRRRVSVAVAPEVILELARALRCCPLAEADVEHALHHRNRPEAPRPCASESFSGRPPAEPVSHAFETDFGTLTGRCSCGWPGPEVVRVFEGREYRDAPKVLRRAWNMHARGAKARGEGVR